MTLEELPPVLVLHMKRFVFEKTGGCQKLVKNVDYPVDLEISKGMSRPSASSACNLCSFILKSDTADQYVLLIPLYIFVELS